MALQSESTHRLDTLSQDGRLNLSAKVWSASAPKAVRSADRSGDRQQEWSAWKRYLSTRRKPKPLGKLLRSRMTPLAWCLSRPLVEGPTGGLLEQLSAWKKPTAATPERKFDWNERVSSWLDAADAAVDSAAAETAYGLETLAWCHALPRLAAELSPEPWWRLLEHLIAAADQAQQLQVQVEPLATQLLAGELPLTLAYTLPELVPCRDLAPLGRRCISHGLVEILSAEGLPSAACLEEFRPLVACWTRVRAMAAAGNQKNRHTSDGDQFRSAVESVLRLSRRDGTSAFSDLSGGTAAADSDCDWLRVALRLAGSRSLDRLAAVLLSDRCDAKKKSTLERLPAPAVHSEAARLTLMRTGWRRSDPRLSIAWAEREVLMELAVGRDTIFSGPWTLDVRAAGAPAKLESDWDEVCWVTDDDVDYLELEATLAGGWNVERSILLARNGQFVLLTDAVFGPRATALEYASRLPIAGGIQFKAADENREGRLVGRKPRGTVVPLALPEWRSERGRGELAETGRGLELRQLDHGARLFAPLFIDLNPRRLSRALTWRQLTVAQDRTIEPREVAVGYRVQIGNPQWLIYRSLADRASRSVLGQNLSSDFLVARFRRSGKVETLLEIE